jgi:hypothetical protein
MGSQHARVPSPASWTSYSHRKWSTKEARRRSWDRSDGLPCTGAGLAAAFGGGCRHLGAPRSRPVAFPSGNDHCLDRSRRNDQHGRQRHSPSVQAVDLRFCAPGRTRTCTLRIRSADRPVQQVPLHPSPQLTCAPSSGWSASFRVVSAGGMTTRMTGAGSPIPAPRRAALAATALWAAVLLVRFKGWEQSLTGGPETLMFPETLTL